VRDISSNTPGIAATVQKENMGEIINLDTYRYRLCKYKFCDIKNVPYKFCYICKFLRVNFMVCNMKMLRIITVAYNSKL
jgi:hypothetical protein